MGSWICLFLPSEFLLLLRSKWRRAHIDARLSWTPLALHPFANYFLLSDGDVWFRGRLSSTHFFFMTSFASICLVALLRTSAMVSTLSRKRDLLKGFSRNPFTNASTNISLLCGLIFTMTSQKWLRLVSPLFVVGNQINLPVLAALPD